MPALLESYITRFPKKENENSEYKKSREIIPLFQAEFSLQGCTSIENNKHESGKRVLRVYLPKKGEKREKRVARVSAKKSS